MAEKEIIITELTRDISIGKYEPGTGTSYKAIAVRWESEANFNILGEIRAGGWLVVSCNTGLSYLFLGEGTLMDSYIREKLGGLSADYPYFGDLIRRLIGREN